MRTYPISFSDNNLFPGNDGVTSPGVVKWVEIIAGPNACTDAVEIAISLTLPEQCLVVANYLAEDIQAQISNRDFDWLLPICSSFIPGGRKAHVIKMTDQ